MTTIIATTLRRFWLPGLLALGLAGCATGQDRYAAAYDACDRQVGFCYDQCRTEGDEGVRAACQDRCGAQVNQCFASVTDGADRRAVTGIAAAPSAYVFYGRFGQWSPYGGYRFGPHGRRFSYDPYGWGPRAGLGGRFGFGRLGPHRGGYRHPNTVRTQPVIVIGGAGTPTTTAPTTDGAPTPTTRSVAADGSVYSAEGRRLRFGGKPNVAPRGVQMAEPRAAAPRPATAERPVVRRPVVKRPVRRATPRPDAARRAASPRPTRSQVKRQAR